MNTDIDIIPPPAWLARTLDTLEGFRGQVPEAVLIRARQILATIEAEELPSPRIGIRPRLGYVELLLNWSEGTGQLHLLLVPCPWDVGVYVLRSDRGHPISCSNGRRWTKHLRDGLAALYPHTRGTKGEDDV